MALLLQCMRHMLKPKQFSLLSLSFAAFLGLAACSGGEDVQTRDESRADNLSECTKCGDGLIECLSSARLALNGESLAGAEVYCQDSFGECSSSLATCEAPPLDTTCTNCFDGMIECISSARGGGLEVDALITAESGCQMDFNDCEAIVINEECAAPELTSCTDCHDEMIDCVEAARLSLEGDALLTEETGCRMNFSDCEAAVIGDECVAPVFKTCTECHDDMVQCVRTAREGFDGDALITAESGCQMTFNECEGSVLLEECEAPDLSLTCLDCGTNFVECIANSRGAGLDFDAMIMAQSGCQMDFSDCHATVISQDSCVRPGV